MTKSTVSVDWKWICGVTSSYEDYPPKLRNTSLQLRILVCQSISHNHVLIFTGFKDTWRRTDGAELLSTSPRSMLYPNSPTRKAIETPRQFHQEEKASVAGISVSCYALEWFRAGRGAGEESWLAVWGWQRRLPGVRRWIYSPGACPSEESHPTIWNSAT